MRAIFVVVALMLSAPAFAQDTARTQQLEEQVRQLTGRVEELSFQLLQMEERMRKMQEDNEFRFQELEDAADKPVEKTERSATEGGEGLGKPDGDAVATTRSPNTDTAASTEKPVDGAPTSTVKPPPAAKREVAKKEPTLRFDEDGKLLAGPASGPRPKQDDIMSVLKPKEAPFGSPSEAAFAAAAFGSTPDAVFARGRELYRSGDYAKAAEAFEAHVNAWPKDGRKPQAQYWLGESFFRQGQFYDAATALIEAHNRHPDASTAPDVLLALGLSLAGLEQREVACATYAEVLKQYPEAEARLGAQVKAEQAAARC